MAEIETARLILRPFTPEDAEDVFSYASDPRVGPIAGWPPHQSMEESRTIIRDVFSLPGIFAMELKENHRALGSIGYVGRHPAGEQPGCPDDEIGYGLHPGYWGQGLMPEALEAVLQYGFTDLSLCRIWCGHYAGNWRSARVIRKCGFHYQFSFTEFVEEMDEWRQTYDYMQTREEWHERISGSV